MLEKHVLTNCAADNKELKSWTLHDKKKTCSQQFLEILMKYVICSLR